MGPLLACRPPLAPSVPFLCSLSIATKVAQNGGSRPRPQGPRSQARSQAIRPSSGRSSEAPTKQPKAESVSGAAPRTRRHLLSEALAGVSLLTLPLLDPSTAQAADNVETTAKESATSFETFESAKDQYTLLVPAGWDRGEGSVGTRKLLAFHPLENTDTNVSILITPLGADFTGLGSFGTVDSFGEALVGSLDQSYKRKPGQRAVLVDTKAKNGMYYVEYTLQKPGQPKIRLLSTLAVHHNGTYNQLYTLTAQFLDEESAAYEETIKKMVNSFRLSL